LTGTRQSHKYKPSLQHTINLRKYEDGKVSLGTLREDLLDIQEAEREIDVYAVMVHVEALEDILQGAKNPACSSHQLCFLL